jgi:cation diffusion facilitator family transporter
MGNGEQLEPGDHEKAEVRAIRVAIACSVIGATAKLTAGIITGSMSMISSAVDSLGDLMVSLANLFVVRYGHQPPDEDHNYGHAKIEGLGAMFEGGFILAAALFIAYEAVHKTIIGEASHDTTLGIYVMVPTLFLTLGTVVYLRKIAKQTGSLVIKSDALHYTTDVWVNIGVLVSLALVKLTGKPIIDAVVSIGIAIFMIVSSIRVVREGFDVVMDKSLPVEQVAKVTALLDGCARIDSFHDLRTRGGKIPHVDFHAVVDPKMTAQEVHDLFEELQRGIQDIAGTSTRVHLHADPAPPRKVVAR